MSLVAVTCDACGGAVAARAGEPVPRCLFCGSEAVRSEQVEEGVEPPEVFLPFATDEEGARAAFRKWAGSSFWYPSDLRRAKLELNEILLPAWRWSAQVETHFAGLVSAHTRSGKRPVTGARTKSLSGVLVPASTAISRAELHAISPYDAGEAQPFVDDEAVAPYELGSLTRTAAREAGQQAIFEMHRQAIRAELGASKIHTSALCTGMEGDPLLLPVYVGAYRRKDRLYRVVINGQTGKLVGKAPLSWTKIGCVAFFVLLAILAVLALLGGGAAVYSVSM